jgi:hypothetical protein
MRPTRKAQIREQAERVLNESGQGACWPTDLKHISGCASIVLECVDDPRPFDGRFEFLDGLPFVILNLRGKAFNSGRVRFSLGHEIGHFALHRHLDAGIWTPHDDELEVPKELTVVENEANLFSSHLLFPRPLVREFLRRRSVCAKTVATLAEQANASIQAAAIAISQCTASRCLFLFEQSSTVKWTAPSDEWVESKFPWFMWRDKSLPIGSAVAGGKGSQEELEDQLSIWCPNHTWREGKVFASAIPLSAGRMIVLTCTLETDDALDDWDD